MIEYEQYRKATLKPCHDKIKAQVLFWSKKVERTRKGSEKQREHFLKQEIETLEALKEVLSIFEQVCRVLKEEVENNQMIHLAQADEIVKLTEKLDELNKCWELGTLYAVNTALSSMIIKQDLN